MDTAFSTEELQINPITPKSQKVAFSTEVLDIGEFSLAEISYIYGCLSVISMVETKFKRKDHHKVSRELVTRYIKTHSCKRCGVWGLGMEKDFKFFEMHLPKLLRVKHLVKIMSPELLQLELEKRDLFCRKCYPHIVREVTHNIPAPPVKPFTVI